MIYGVFILVAAGGCSGSRVARPPRRWLRAGRARAVVAADRQHRHPRPAGCSARRCEQTKTRFRELLNAGQADRSRRIYAGLDFAVKVGRSPNLCTGRRAGPESQLNRTLRSRAAGTVGRGRRVAPNRATACQPSGGGYRLPSHARWEAIAFRTHRRRSNRFGGRMGAAGGVTLAAFASLRSRGLRAGLAIPPTRRREQTPADPWVAMVVVEAERTLRRLGHCRGFSGYPRACRTSGDANPLLANSGGGP